MQIFGNRSHKQFFEVIEAFNSTSRYLDDLLNIDNNFFDSMISPIFFFRISVKSGQHHRYRGHM